MTTDEIIEQIARYRDWVEAQPFGAPIDTDAYRAHLEYQEFLRERA